MDNNGHMPIVSATWALALLTVMTRHIHDALHAGVDTLSDHHLYILYTQMPPTEPMQTSEPMLPDHIYEELGGSTWQ